MLIVIILKLTYLSSFDLNNKDGFFSYVKEYQANMQCFAKDGNFISYFFTYLGVCKISERETLNAGVKIRVRSSDFLITS